MWTYCIDQYLYHICGGSLLTQAGQFFPHCICNFKYWTMTRDNIICNISNFCSRLFLLVRVHSATTSPYFRLFNIFFTFKNVTCCYIEILYPIEKITKKPQNLTTCNNYCSQIFRLHNNTDIICSMTRGSYNLNPLIYLKWNI